MSKEATNDSTHVDATHRKDENPGVLNKTVVASALISAASAVLIAWITASAAGANAGKKKVETIAAIPAGAVSFFNLTNCPDGWKPKPNAEGRYLVGLHPESEGSLNQVQGTPLANLENRATGEHTHKYESFYIGGTPGTRETIAWGDQSGADRRNPMKETKGATYASTNTAVPGTNAPYLQLLVCEKK